MLLVEDGSGVLFLEDEKNNLCSFKAVRKVHKVNRHKRKEQLMLAYRNAGWMSPEHVNTINRVVNDCRVCHKFERSVARPRASLPKTTTFNEITYGTIFREFLFVNYKINALFDQTQVKIQ